MKTTSILIGSLLATGCSTYQAATTPLAFDAVAPDAPDNWASADLAGAAEQGDWIAGFNDDRLAGLVREALANNPSLDAQIAVRDAFLADARAARGTLLPFVSGNLNAGGTRQVQEVNGDAVEFDSALYGVGVTASWEADLWGRLRAGVRLSDSDVAIAEADLANARLSVAAQTARAWISLNAAIAQERVADATLEARRRTQDLTERRLARGLSSALDVRLARTTTFQAEASLAAQQRQTLEAARALEILLGRYPAAEIDAPARLPQMAPIEPVLGPAGLLARRPDIRAAEAQVVSAGLRAEQARLALLPALNFTADVSTSQDSLADAFDPAFIAARAIASLTQPLYAGGQLRARRDGFVARAEAAVARYASAALSAWREVEDAFAADAFLARQEEAQARALEEAFEAEALAERQYQNGLVSIFNLIDAQTRRLNAESSLVAVRSQRALNRVAYHLALGGGVPPIQGSLPDALADPQQTSDLS